MFRLPKEIKKMIDTLENEGYQAYVVGGSVRDALLGLDPKDWDIASDAPPEKVRELFPGATPIGDRFGVNLVKIGEMEADVALMRIDGNYSDHRRPDLIQFTGQIEKDLERRDFTINAMGYHPQNGLVDPFGGKKDLSARLIKAVGDPKTRFTEDPLRILRGIRLAGQLDFDIEMQTFEAMRETAHLLEEISMDRRRLELERLVVSKNTGKALRMCVTANVMPSLFGDCYPPKRKQNQGDLAVLLHDIDKSRAQVDLRIALILLCFDNRLAHKAIHDLQFDGVTAKKLAAAIDKLDELYFSVEKYSLKRFIHFNGDETYAFLELLAKQHREVYDAPGFRIESRYYLLEDIKKGKEPIYLKDLAINGDDLIEAGIVEGEKVGEMLRMLLDCVHHSPGINTKKKLLKRAKQLKNPISARFRNIHFIK